MGRTADVVAGLVAGGFIWGVLNVAFTIVPIVGWIFAALIGGYIAAKIGGENAAVLLAFMGAVITFLLGQAILVLLGAVALPLIPLGISNLLTVTLAAWAFIVFIFVIVGGAVGKGSYKSEDCPYCGERRKEGILVCPICGRDLDQAAAVNIEPKAEPYVPPPPPDVRCCETCDGPLEYMARYDRWYCHTCRKYAPQSGEKQATITPFPADSERATEQIALGHSSKELSHWNRQIEVPVAGLVAALLERAECYGITVIDDNSDDGVVDVEARHLTEGPMLVRGCHQSSDKQISPDQVRAFVVRVREEQEKLGERVTGLFVTDGYFLSECYARETRGDSVELVDRDKLRNLMNDYKVHLPSSNRPRQV